VGAHLKRTTVPVLDIVDKETAGDNSSLRTLGKSKVFTNDQDGKDRDANNEDDVELAIHSDHLYQDGLNVIDRIYNPQEVIQPSNNLKRIIEKKLGNQYSKIYPILEFVSSKAMIIGDPAEECVENREDVENEDKLPVLT
jgi:hypothetical protein